MPKAPVANVHTHLQGLGQAQPRIVPADRTQMLLACGVLAGPLFLVTVVIQAVTRDGFDPSRHPLSLLSLGSPGWVQITNFIATGLLVTASAVGLRHTLSGDRAGT